MPLRRRRVKDELEGDAKREMKRAARAHERPSQLEVGAGVDEKPRVLLTEAELPELVETPADDALILVGQLVRGVWVLGCGHVPALTTRYPVSLFAERKTWLRGCCGEGR